MKPPKLPTPKASRPYMGGYELPKGTKGLLPWKWADDRLRKSHNYWIATVCPDGQPHVMLVWGLWQNGAFYFSTGAKSRKARNLDSNPHCVIGTERAEQAVILEGTAKLETDAATLRSFVKTYRKKYKWNMEGLAEPIYTVRPRVAFGLVEKNVLSTATRWRF